MKIARLLLACILSVMAVAVFACGGTAEEEPTTPTPSASEVNVDASYNGSQVTLAMGKQLIVTLDSNATTGFSWNLSETSDTIVITKLSDEYIAPEGTPMMGQGGQEVWTFEALAAGTADISMIYIQSWIQPPDPADTFDITVIVE
ncbi:MAG: protease inhibitor I42 family protein [Chloroflexota bacterium]|nr:protease inhibitor I42 family protein [Chloroflexota bacterium]